MTPSVAIYFDDLLLKDPKNPQNQYRVNDQGETEVIIEAGNNLVLEYMPIYIDSAELLGTLSIKEGDLKLSSSDNWKKRRIVFDLTNGSSATLYFKIAGYPKKGKYLEYEGSHFKLIAKASTT